MYKILIICSRNKCGVSTEVIEYSSIIDAENAFDSLQNAPSTFHDISFFRLYTVNDELKY